MEAKDSPWAVPVISAIVEREEDGVPQILVQTRVATYDKTYNGCLEIPAGKIDRFENVYDTIIREVKEETGLDIVKITPPREARSFNTPKADEAIGFQPYYCQQLTKGNVSWIGFVFLCKAEGELHAAEGETKDLRWISLADLRELIDSSQDNIFTLQLPVLDYYLRDKGF